MNPETKALFEKRIKNAIEVLTPKGFIHLGGWHFLLDGVNYDLSAADLDQIDRIVKNRSFVVENWWKKKQGI